MPIKLLGGKVKTLKINLPGQTTQVLLVSENPVSDETIGHLKGEIDLIFNKASVKDRAEPWEPLLKKCVGKFNMELVYASQKSITNGESE